MKTSIHTDEFRVSQGENMKLTEWPTSSAAAPWYVIPADDKKNARLIISQILLDTYDELEMAYPKTTAKRRRELKKIRKQL